MCCIVELMKGLRVVMVVVGAAILVAVLGWLTSGHDLPILNPKGAIGEEQRNLIIVATLLMLIVVLPVFALTGYIAWKYRETNTKAKYQPDMDGNKVLETIWWGLPFAIIAVLSVIIWNTSHSLDPYREIERDKAPLTIQVVALQWKWLFIYPEQDIATVNYLQIPEDTPINFRITADAPMNSFWIPSLGGQIYAMSGMETKLHLIADEPGTYEGSSANISGEGFAGMRFKTVASSQSNFTDWVASIRKYPRKLDATAYDELAQPSKDVLPMYYSSRDQNLFDTIMMKYMSPSADKTGGNYEHAH